MSKQSGIISLQVIVMLIFFLMLFQNKWINIDKAFV